MHQLNCLLMFAALKQEDLSTWLDDTNKQLELVFQADGKRCFLSMPNF